MIKQLVLLLFVIFSTLTGEEIFIRKVENISYRPHNGSTIALIKLTDGSIWKWFPDAYSETLLRGWEEGDKIFIEVANTPGFLLHNLSKPHYTPTVALSFNSYTVYPAIKSYDKRKCTILLDDGTEWGLLDDYSKRTLCHWSVGDRIIPVESPFENFQLINIDIPYDNRSQIERHIEVLPRTLPLVRQAIAERAQEKAKKGLNS